MYKGQNLLGVIIYQVTATEDYVALFSYDSVYDSAGKFGVISICTQMKVCEEHNPVIIKGLRQVIKIEVFVCCLKFIYTIVIAV